MCLAATLGAPIGLVAVDHDGDGVLDLATSSQRGWLALMRGRGDGSFEPPAGTWVGIGQGSSPRSILAADLDDDGRADLAVGLQGGYAISVFLNR